MGTVSGGKRIIDINIAIFSQCFGKCRIVLFFAFMEACIFEKNNITVFQGIDSGFRFFANAVLGKSDCFS